METGDRPRADAASSRAKRWAGSLLGYGIAAGCLYWVFHGIRWPDLLKSLESVHWWWVLPAAVLTVLVYICAAWEWQLLLRPVGRLSLRQSAKVIFVGRFANDVLPVHAGYILRVYLASRWLGVSIGSVVPSLLVERLLDSFWLALGIGFTTLLFPMPNQLARGGEVLGGGIVGGVALVTWIILRKSKGDRRPGSRGFLRWKLLRKARGFITDFSDGIRCIGRSYLILAALGLSILKLIIQALAFLALLNSYDFPFPFGVRLAVFMITYIGMSMPSTPASMGVFQLFCVAGLMFFGVPKATASGFALLAFVVLTGPLSVAGFLATTRSGLTWSQLRQEVRHWNHPGPVNGDG